MKHMKTTDVPATTRTIVDKITCDLCSNEVGKVGHYKMYETEIRYKEGTQYPETAWGTETTVDICDKCFVGVLIPWLKSQGAVPRVEEWDW